MLVFSFYNFFLLKMAIDAIKKHAVKAKVIHIVINKSFVFTVLLRSATLSYASVIGLYLFNFGAIFSMSKKPRNKADIRRPP